MQLLDLENKELLREISTEEFANVSGGGLLTAAAYNTVTNIIPALANSAAQRNTTFLFAINAQTAPESSVSP
ncbi:hypothetical protein B4U84_19080 [Westiellopsis prolifica IICB1]|nr:hypothetical protein B4U84_19080 [Westiellopsis prolifica IICB1]